MKPEISSSVPADDIQLNLNVTDEGASPLPFSTWRPGQLNSFVTLSRAFLTGPICATANTAMMTTYGAYARITSAGVPPVRSRRCTSRSSVGAYPDAPATAGRGPANWPSIGSVGCQTRVSATIAAAEP